MGKKSGHDLNLPDRGVGLYAFTCGWISLPLDFFVAGEAGPLRFPVTAFLIAHDQGLALFDTGLGPRFEPAPGKTVTRNVDFHAGVTIAARLLAIGVDPAAVRWIINSHLHTDHCGGNLHCPNATVIIQSAEWDHALGSDDHSYKKREFDIGQPVLRICGEHDLFGDGSVVLFPTPGHTPGHQSARVQTPRGPVILAADCCTLRRTLDGLLLPSECHDADAFRATLRMLARMERAGSTIMFGHDPDFWARVPQSVPL